MSHAMTQLNLLKNSGRDSISETGSCERRHSTAGERGRAVRWSLRCACTSPRPYLVHVVADNLVVHLKQKVGHYGTPWLAQAVDSDEEVVAQISGFNL